MQRADAHRSVLLDEVIRSLNIRQDGHYVDATFGRGGHAQAILDRLGPAGRLLAMDKDPEAVAAAKSRFAGEPRFTIDQGTFAMLNQVVEQNDLQGQIHGVLLDLGVSSPQLDDPQRGFSFLHDGPLDMRMDTNTGVRAADWIAQATASQISQILREYGEERFHRRIAQAIVNARMKHPIVTTKQLADVVAAAVPKWEKHKHPATRSFQAIRIFINQELDDLRSCLNQVIDLLAPAGRLVVISFHSLEDRMVKRFMREQARGKAIPLDLPLRESELHFNLRIIGKAIRPSAEEIEQNARARSAIMRVAERIQ